MLAGMLLKMIWDLIWIAIGALAIYALVVGVLALFVSFPVICTVVLIAGIIGFNKWKESYRLKQKNKENPGR